MPKPTRKPTAQAAKHPDARVVEGMRKRIVELHDRERDLLNRLDDAEDRAKEANKLAADALDARAAAAEAAKADRKRAETTALRNLHNLQCTRADKLQLENTVIEQARQIAKLTADLRDLRRRNDREDYVKGGDTWPSPFARALAHD